MTTTTASRTIEELRKLFATHSLSEQLVSDNRPRFIGDEFGEFMRQSNGINHIKSALYHPATNGMAERFVQTFKQALCAALAEKKSISTIPDIVFSPIRYWKERLLNVSP